MDEEAIFETRNSSDEENSRRLRPKRRFRINNSSKFISNHQRSGSHGMAWYGTVSCSALMT